MSVQLDRYTKAHLLAKDQFVMKQVNLWSGHGALYQCAYGRYVISMNMSPAITYSVLTPRGVGARTLELVSRQHQVPGSAVKLGPLGTIVWDLGGLPFEIPSQALNCGGGVAGNFSVDQFFTGGYSFTSVSAVSALGVTNPAPQMVYQTERLGGDFTYTIPYVLPGGSYMVRLHFAELRWEAKGKRVFHVSINGLQVLSYFDIFAAAGGKNKAIVKEFAATGSSSGTIVIQYTAVMGDAKASGIEVVPLSYAVNAGGTSIGVFQSDDFYVGGDTSSTSETITMAGLVNPALQAVYQEERVGDFTYTIPHLVPGGAYMVRLHFAELYWEAAGRRIFNVSINGSRVLTNFDIFTVAGGKNVAVIRECMTIADEGGVIIIQFTSVVGKAKVSGIEILSLT
jgi:hypothetical protein